MRPLTVSVIGMIAASREPVIAANLPRSAGRATPIRSRVAGANRVSFGAHRVVAGVVRELGQAERLEQRRQVHAEPAAVALAQPVPAADRVVLGAAPRLDRAVLWRASARRRRRAAPSHPGAQPGVQVLDRAPLVVAASSTRPGRPAAAGRRSRRGTSCTRTCPVAVVSTHGSSFVPLAMGVILARAGGGARVGFSPGFPGDRGRTGSTGLPSSASAAARCPRRWVQVVLRTALRGCPRQWVQRAVPGAATTALASGCSARSPAVPPRIGADAYCWGRGTTARAVDDRTHRPQPRLRGTAATRRAARSDAWTRRSCCARSGARTR